MRFQTALATEFHLILFSFCGYQQPWPGVSKCSFLLFALSILHIGTKVRWQKGLGNHSCLGQMNGCSPSCPSVVPVCIPGTVNTDVQYPFLVKMPNICNHSSALTKLAFWHLQAKQKFSTTAERVWSCLDWGWPSETWNHNFTKDPNIR
jgi:hypothetical protein